MTKKDFLSTLLGTVARAKVLRLFLFNEEQYLSLEEVSRRAQVTKAVARKELSFLVKLKVIKTCSLFEEVMRARGKQRKTKKVRVKGWTVNTEYEYLRPLQVFVRDTSPVPSDTIAGRLRSIGKLKLVIAAGTFMEDQDPVSRVDLLIVADSIKERNLQRALRTIESELGRELRYAAFPTEEFRYRMNVYDKLIRDIFDYRHQILLDKLGITL